MKLSIFRWTRYPPNFVIDERTKFLSVISLSPKKNLIVGLGSVLPSKRLFVVLVEFSEKGNGDKMLLLSSK